MDPHRSDSRMFAAQLYPTSPPTFGQQGDIEMGNLEDLPPLVPGEADAAPINISSGDVDSQMSEDDVVTPRPKSPLEDNHSEASAPSSPQPLFQPDYLPYIKSGAEDVIDMPDDMPAHYVTAFEAEREMLKQSWVALNAEVRRNWQHEHVINAEQRKLDETRGIIQGQAGRSSKEGRRIAGTIHSDIQHMPLPEAVHLSGQIANDVSLRVRNDLIERDTNERALRTELESTNRRIDTANQRIEELEQEKATAQPLSGGAPALTQANLDARIQATLDARIQAAIDAGIQAVEARAQTAETRAQEAAESVQASEARMQTFQAGMQAAIDASVQAAL